jgi:hypothetical protein
MLVEKPFSADQTGGNQEAIMIMKKAPAPFFWFLLALLPAAVHAAPMTVSVPGQGWQLSFDAPVFVDQKAVDHPDQYMYWGSSGRFNLSIYVETPGCKGGVKNEDFLDCFWPKASRNPLIVKESIDTRCNETYCRIAYDIKAALRGQPLRQVNRNFIFAYRGKWTDVHVSVLDPTETDLKLLDAFETSLNYGASP